MFSRPPDLYKGTTRAFGHSLWTDLVLSDKLTRNATAGAITAALSFKNPARISSNPVAFFTFKSLSCFRIYFSEIGCRIKRSLVNFLLERLKDWKSLLIFTFSLPRVKNSVVSIGKGFQTSWWVLPSSEPCRLRKFRSTDYAYTTFSHLLQYHSLITTWANGPFDNYTTDILKPPTHYGEIWKRCFHSENASTLYAGEINNVTINGIFGFIFEENSAREITWFS